MTPTRLQQLFVPNYEEGTLVWRISNSSRAKVGGQAGRLHKGTGYVRVSVDGSEQWVHRVLWTMAFGQIPEGVFIDHINCNRSDNRITNLRLADRTVNGINRSGPAPHCSSGSVGVRFKKGAYEVAMTVHGRLRYGGRFKNLEDAAAVREAMKVAVLEELQARAA